MVFANLLQEMYLTKLFLGRSHMGTLGAKRLKKTLRARALPAIP